MLCWVLSHVRVFAATPYPIPMHVFVPGCSVGAEPSLTDLLRHVVPTVAAQWKMLGYALGVKPEVLNTVEYNERRAERCAMELLALWLRRAPGTGDQPRTWHSVLEAVETVIGPGEKERIEAKLNTLTTDSSLHDNCQKMVSICVILNNIIIHVSKLACGTRKLVVQC